MPYPYSLSFKKSVILKEDGADLLIMESPNSALRVKRVSPGIRDILNTLHETRQTEDVLCHMFSAREGSAQTEKFWYYIQKLDDKGYICRTVFLKGHDFCTIIPVSPYFKFKEEDIDPDRKFFLSRFAYCRIHDGRMVLESPLGHAKLELGSQSAALTAELSTAASISEISKRLDAPEAGEIHAFFTLLLNINALDEATPVDGPPAAQKTALAQWDFHDLLFHTRSRAGRHDNPLGGTYRFLEKIDPLPALKPKMPGKTIALFRPDIEMLKKKDLPFTQILETRQSIRDYSQNSQTPLTIGQVGEFLFRSARVKGIHNPDPARGSYYQSTTRPSPGAGAMHGFELYPLINECDGIDPGLYHYDPMDHEFTLVSAPTIHTEKLLDFACMASALQYEPGILFLLAARFQRIAWKYESIAYSLMLKDLGALYQTLYLVATAMGLAPCAIGAGDSDLFAHAAGLDYYIETSVGEFLLGSRQMN